VIEKSVKFLIEDFGPFRKAEFELRPLTLIVGRNTVGKSMLIYLLWSFIGSLPDFGYLFEYANKRGATELAKEILELIKEGKAPKDQLLKLLKLHIEGLPQALAIYLSEILEDVFGTPLAELIRKGSNDSRIRVESSKFTLECVLRSSGVDVRFLNIDMEFLNNLEIEVLKPGYLRTIDLRSGKIIVEESIGSIRDIANIVMKHLADYMIHTLNPISIGDELAALLADSRAGITKTLLKPYLDPLIAKTLLYPDEHYIRLYYRLSEKLARGGIELSIIEPLLSELGVKVESILEHGVFRIYLTTWTGHRVPFELAPSGIRESLVLSLALATREEPYVVLVEEPEAHLHPRAQKMLAKLIARSVNKFKKNIVLTTHSDYMLFTFSNMVALSKAPEKAAELGYDSTEVLDPKIISAYLVKQVGDVAELVELEVTSEGIDEESFAEVARELADEKAEILASRH